MEWMISKNYIFKKMAVFCVLMMGLVFGNLFMLPVYANSVDTTGKNPGINDIDVKITGGQLDTGLNTGDGESTANDALTKYKGIIMVFLGFCLITMIGVFIYNFTRLGTTASNANARREVILGLVVSGVATAGLGSVMIFVGFFYNLLG